jgi:hypothetical protein
MARDPVIALRHVLAPLGRKVKAQISVKRGKLAFSQGEQFRMRCGFVRVMWKRRFNLPIRPGSFSTSMSCRRSAARPGFGLGQVRNRQSEGSRLQRHANRVGIRRIARRDLGDDGALVGYEVQQGTGSSVMAGVEGLFGPGRASPLRGRPRRVNTSNGANQSATIA